MAAGARGREERLSLAGDEAMNVEAEFIDEYRVDETCRCSSAADQVDVLARSPLKGGDFVGDACVPDEPITTTPTIDLRHRELAAALRRGTDQFEVDERLAQLVGALTERAAPGRFTARRSTTRANHRRVVQQAREAIVADPAGTDFADLARMLGHTRFHLSRVFSQVTGMTLSQFRNRVRVAIAFHRLADGYENLALLSADLGFADQSHLSQVVRTHTGTRLSELRKRLAPVNGPRPSPKS